MAPVLRYHGQRAASRISGENFLAKILNPKAAVFSFMYLMKFLDVLVTLCQVSGVITQVYCSSELDFERDIDRAKKTTLADWLPV